ncbi:hypothetical protein AGABI1DRAFT_73904 [Agaricus bisporus var. burnettii JB137-S8]|uniref:Large ribosomal subunit protein uL5 C-terminal domain-containing protein n=1 Tax=Agaricus bisporus var. burnettii (strain JB137-S8 / ATCC MYA-4627 / FGSC 10392) TaxID=597362 RepID=K5WUL7_AGABU|nr:hypothetical protein AGABI2DRAFT_193565 [Agaricus bisporus var. bisporus H97]XP_007329741.1 uncharacterized protein AGABI1DRAFT_73904 [Agaricus bisporus var. burnettii JB137-S8]EKM79116.1 hypothetical protein AGABI1DRAFT_73904 [Agaricus bisporus var. burnettii JB137-S8]EKV45589.1 hypothetical protein AGABI2DRAFT_193565 [Agaricus bisporus var. bisporus H97]
MSAALSKVTPRPARFGRAPAIRGHLRKDRRTGLPRPPVPIVTREFAPCRFQDHYYNTLQDDLMYMTYHHEHLPRSSTRQIRRKFDPEDPYTKNRHNPPVGGSQIGKKPAPPTTASNVVRLEKVVIHSMVKEALQNKSNLLGPLMALRALTGENNKAGGQHAVEGVQIVRGKKAVGGWIRPGVPVGVKVELKGQSMYDFIGSLVEFVLPRLREFNGVVLPPQSSSVNSPSAVSGVVTFGLPPQAMGFFPQIEVNQDAYPKMYGMHIHFVTNASGLGAENRARALVSGFQIPFVRR